jgi:YHS domain-containing protein
MKGIQLKKENHMKKSWLIILVVFTALSVGAVGWSHAQTASGKAQTICPVMGGNINKDVYADHQGKRVYFCCPACIPEFKKTPEKYLKKLEAEGVQLPSATGK